MVGLILEGGGTRGAYTAGVLDVFTDNNIFMPVTYGVSAGACNALSYLSKQKKRNYRIYTEYSSDKRYCSKRLLFRTGSLFGFDFIFGELAAELLPFDYEEYKRTSMTLRVCTTDINSGKPVFFESHDFLTDFTPVIASASLPVVANIVKYKGHELLDGGVVAPIPIEYAMQDGLEKNVLILTRDRSYVKKDKPDFPLFWLKHKYKKYPALIQGLIDRARVYNHEREICFEQEQLGNAFIIEPSEPITISRSCTDTAMLDSIYQMGVNDAKNKLADLNRFLALNS